MKPEIKQFISSEKMVLNFDYKGKRLNARELLKQLRHPLVVGFRFLIFKIAMYIPSSGFKSWIYRFFGGMRVGKDVVISDGVYIDPYFPELISIDDGAFLGSGSKILSHEATIKHVRLGKVKIGMQVLVGANSLVRSGVNLKQGSVIAMDSFVNKDVEKLVLVGGVPEHEIKKLKELI
jgi:acetyltransferase-like isoleucine patch superfamily enzyme